MKKYLMIFFVSLFFIVYAENGLHAQYEEEQFRVGGFMSLDYMNYNFKRNNSIMGTQISDNGAFTQTFLNLYFTFNIDRSWKAFSEIRFYYAPSGNNTIEPGEQTDPLLPPDNVIATPVNNNVTDRVFVNFKHGTINIERAYIEWNELPYANVRFGRYFTPFGIWSQDHGAPAVLGVRFPFVAIAPLPQFGMPVTQTGIELLGNIPVGSGLFEYALYVGNGISNSDATNDDYDKNKAVGGFINLKLPAIADVIEVEFGGSGYVGDRSTLLNTKYDLSYSVGMIDGALTIYPTYHYNAANHRFTSKQLDKIAMAHLKISIASLPFNGVFVIQGEGLFHRADMYKDVRIVDQLTQLHVGERDYNYYSYYGQVEYQIYGMLTPYFRYERIDIGSPLAMDMILAKNGDIYITGINFRPVPKVSMKVEMYTINVNNPFMTPGFMEKLNIFISSISVAF